MMKIQNLIVSSNLCLAYFGNQRQLTLFIDLMRSFALMFKILYT